MELKLLHLSDIHFQHYGANDHLDYDNDLRNELELDLTRVVKKMGSINAILITGDIAFSGKENEYSKASDWLDKICRICDCKVENVLTVPGNHDINRNINPMILSTHEKFKRIKKRPQIDLELQKYLANDEVYSFLLNPLKDYITFSQKYGTFPRQNSLFWEKDLEFGDVKLRIRGLNSTIISNENDDENDSRLILGEHQTSLIRENGVVYLTLCHHPPEWLFDGKDVEVDLHARAKIQLFGHKHIFELTKDDKTLRLSAGAVHPSRKENEWEPRYNLLCLDCIKKEEKKQLKVKLWERIWNKEEKQFCAKIIQFKSEFSEYELPLEDIENPIELKKGIDMSAKTSDTKCDEIELINLATPNHKRRLAYMFFDLPFHQKISIASALNLIEDSDENLSTIQQSQKYLKKAIDQSLLKELWDQIAKLKPTLTEINPFN